MKKSLVLLSTALMVGSVFGMSSCGEDVEYIEGNEVALVTDVGNIDDHSFNQATWEGCKDFSLANNVGTTYYRPGGDSTDERVTSIENAIDAGAKVVVMPGYLFNSSIKLVQDKYPNVDFLGIDCDNSDDDNGYTPYEFKDNVTSIKYEEDQAGFLAGYAAVAEGYRKLGFCGGMAVPAVVKYGQGFIKGADQAAGVLGLADGAIKIEYWYSGTFAPDSSIVTKVGGWYSSGTEVVFSCGGGIYSSVVQAAENENSTLGNKSKKVIGVDVDQHKDSDLIITSAMKNLRLSVSSYLTSLYANDMTWGTIDGKETAGEIVTKGVDTESVGLPTDSESWLMENFTVEDYNELYAKLKSGEISGDVDDTTNLYTNPTAKVVVTVEA
ncbi:MAG: BMP family ABC transporter substrate-binding protein [Bacilli bacterium]|nr:BMP family ABC transporter substrate-binding protein [Bacilli bacterium]